MRTRQDVWTLTRNEGTWPQVLVAYRQGVHAMRKLDPANPNAKPTNPLSWLYQAAIHGRGAPGGGHDTSNPQWSNCQHGSWFFMPWHRMYLLAFESVIQHFLADANWSLPYWYSIDPDHPDTSALPPAFIDTTAGNDLFTAKRSVRANGGKRLSFFTDLANSLRTALVAGTFSTDDGTDTFGGGRRDDPSYSGDEQGLLEDVPHGNVHVLVGNDYDAFGNPIRRGWMGAFETAAQDPIFWCHHANIDRLWQMWLDADPAHKNPILESHWANTRFSFPNPAGGAALSWKISEVVDTTALGYRYDTVKVPSGVPTPAPVLVGGPGPLEGLQPEDEQAPPPPPQVVGATTGVPMVADQRTDVALRPPDDTGLEAFHQPYRRVLLRLEGITGTIAAPMYNVYLNIPPGDSPAQHPERLAGTISTFGVPEASRSDAQHGGTGLTKVLDITAVRDTLVEADQWDADNVSVLFVPLIPETPEDALEGFDDVEQPAGASDLRAARVVVVLA
ncbi:tyrosinase family protein [Mycolicibacterium moriokaense]|nr:tyrosinase family protein [Mycolicibacterium moriokaense]